MRFLRVLTKFLAILADAHAVSRSLKRYLTASGVVEIHREPEFESSNWRAQRLPSR